MDPDLNPNPDPDHEHFFKISCFFLTKEEFKYFFSLILMLTIITQSAIQKFLIISLYQQFRFGA